MAPVPFLSHFGVVSGGSHAAISAGDQSQSRRAERAQRAAGAVDMRWSLAGELACAFIDAPHQAVPPMLHATVLEAIHRRICVLPVRFGVALRDEAEIRALLRRRRHEMLDQLSRLDRTCEMGLRIALAEVRPNTARFRRPPSAQPQSPLAYIEQRRSLLPTGGRRRRARPLDGASSSSSDCRAAIGNGGSCPPPRRTRSGWHFSSNEIG